MAMYLGRIRYNGFIGSADTKKQVKRIGRSRSEPQRLFFQPPLFRRQKAADVVLKINGVSYSAGIAANFDLKEYRTNALRHQQVMRGNGKADIGPRHPDLRERSVGVGFVMER